MILKQGDPGSMELRIQRKLLEELTKIADTAGDAIMAVYEGDFTVEFKEGIDGLFQK